ncbi:MAG: glycosyl transferase family protein, partial [Phycisphaerales bacterium]|nr:glycosyl transferase family protein [Phycisphaerales bacterium]
QRNWATDHIAYKHDWVFHLDADERFTEEMVAEMRAKVTVEADAAGFYVPHKLMFMGRWLRRAEGGYPIYQMRLFHRGRMRFRDYGHGQREDTPGPIGTLRRPYLHYNFSKGLDEWIDKHNRYSTLEAQQLLAGAGTSSPDGGRTPAAPGRFWGNRVERRRYFKAHLWPKLPGTWLLRFGWMYLAQGGFLDGLPGFHYCVLMSGYELWTKLKAEEMRVDRSDPVPQPPLGDGGASSLKAIQA